MENLIKVENDTLARDVATSALLETDTLKLQRHRSIKRLMKEKEQRIDALTDRINNLEKIIERMLNNG